MKSTVLLKSGFFHKLNNESEKTYIYDRVTHGNVKSVLGEDEIR